jgi:hypothetical protein
VRLKTNKIGRTSVDSSKNEYVRFSIRSSAFSIRSAYCPTIQMIAAFASGSSNRSRFSHRMGMIFSYWSGNLRKMSLMTTMASCTTYVTLFSMSSTRTLIQSSAALETLMARRPMERTAFRTKSISTSVAYLGLHENGQKKFQKQTTHS